MGAYDKVQSPFQNVIRWRLNTKNVRGVQNFKRGKDYSDRCPLMVAMAKGRGVSLATTQEAGQFVDGDRYAKELGDIVGHPFANILHGDDAGDITQSVAFDEELYDLVAEGSITTVGTDHNTVTWVRLKHKQTRIEFLVAAPHLEWRKGPSRDAMREKQILAGVPQIEKLAGGAAVIWSGDMNSFKEQSIDGPGRAFKKLGYVDAEDSPCAVMNPKVNSYNGLKRPAVKRSQQLDRAFANPSQATFHKREILVSLDSKGNHRTPWPSDHQPVLFEITIKR